jgi:excisionase family DNA binding protein
LLSEKKAAELLGFSRRTLQGWRSDGGPGLPFVRISKGCVRYRRSDIEAWVEQRIRTSTADDAARGTVLRRPREEQ